MSASVDRNSLITQQFLITIDFICFQSIQNNNNATAEKIFHAPLINENTKHKSFLDEVKSGNIEGILFAFFEPRQSKKIAQLFTLTAMYRWTSSQERKDLSSSYLILLHQHSELTRDGERKHQLKCI